MIAQELSSGSSAEDLMARVTDPAFDPEAATRQYGVVTLAGSAAGYTGQENSPVALDRQDASATVSVQGNILVGEDVVAAALAAFEEASGELAERLLAALVAGSARGGDSRCGDQTANSAALIVGREGDPVWANTDMAGSGPPEDPVPSVFVTVVNHGSNPIPALQSAYFDKRAADGSVVSTQGESAAVGFALGVVMAVIAVVVVAGLALLVWLLRRMIRRRRAAG